MEEENEDVSILISNVPENYRLLELGLRLEEKIEAENSITSIKWISTNAHLSLNTVKVKLSDERKIF